MVAVGKARTRSMQAIAHRHPPIQAILYLQVQSSPWAEIASWHTLEHSTRPLPRAANDGASPARARKKLSIIGLDINAQVGEDITE